MKIIRATDVITVPAELVQVGDVLIEGVVVSKLVADDHVLIRTAHGTIAAEPDELIHVLARLDDLARDVVLSDIIG
jgi:hypothetical protein